MCLCANDTKSDSNCDPESNIVTTDRPAVMVSQAPSACRLRAGQHHPSQKGEKEAPIHKAVGLVGYLWTFAKGARQEGHGFIRHREVSFTCYIFFSKIGIP